MERPRSLAPLSCWNSTRLRGSPRSQRWTAATSAHAANRAAVLGRERSLTAMLLLDHNGPALARRLRSVRRSHVAYAPHMDDEPMNMPLRNADRTKVGRWCHGQARAACAREGVQRFFATLKVELVHNALGTRAPRHAAGTSDAGLSQPPAIRAAASTQNTGNLTQASTRPEQAHD